MKRIFLLLAMLSLSLALFECKNIFSSELNQIEVNEFTQVDDFGVEDNDLSQDETSISSELSQIETNDFPQVEDLGAEDNDLSQDEESMADIDDPLDNEPDDKPIDLARLQQLAADGYIIVGTHKNGMIASIEGNFSSIKATSYDNALLIFNQLSPLFNYTIKSIDDIEFYSVGEQTHYFQVSPTINGVTIQDSKLMLVRNIIDFSIEVLIIRHEQNLDNQDNPFYDYLEWLANQLSQSEKPY
jgi:hypothetical protein